jgi:transcriptional regulator with XRE-family HTH domain
MVAPEEAERFGRNLLAARRRAGFSQEELGALAALHRTEIGLLENGRRVPRVDWVPRMPSEGSYLIER